MKDIAHNRPKYRIYCPELDQNSKLITISESESKYLTKVLRAKEGAVVSIFNGKGAEAKGKLLYSNFKSAEIAITEFQQSHKSKFEVILVQALPKAKTMESIIRHCCELGISEIIPLKTQNSEVQIDDRKEQSKINKWRLTTIEGCKQSCNPFLPQISEIVSLNQFISQHGDDLLLTGAIHPKSQKIPFITKEIAGRFHPLPNKIFVLIGPEGDFSKDEYDMLEKSNSYFFSLGSLILKVDTAATVSLFSIKNLLTG